MWSKLVVMVFALLVGVSPLPRNYHAAIVHLKGGVRLKAGHELQKHSEIPSSLQNSDLEDSNIEVINL